ncbi:hypothetical protein AC579_8074 [Pseudocercospora musae]|uniref:Uncharacterized protein n=1 Tax=Pseudocercospora musae TaxID=113226 RepID=A0A139IGA8_9PEZI|nr:hypothetical protein AC579_8074 [Pseudocercospora musae]
MTCINVNTAENSSESVSQTTLCPGDANYSGLRQQIFANATVLFPQMLKYSVTYGKNGVFDPEELFQVITSFSGSKYKAILVCGVTIAKNAVARGPEADCAVEALAGLLKTLSEAMGWYTDTLLGEIATSEESENGGRVNLGMVSDGFHFASVQRWAQDNKGN